MCIKVKAGLSSGSGQHFKLIGRARIQAFTLVLILGCTDVSYIILDKQEISQSEIVRYFIGSGSIDVSEEGLMRPILVHDGSNATERQQLNLSSSCTSGILNTFA